MSKILIVNPNSNYDGSQLPYLYLVLKSYYHEFGKHQKVWNWPLPLTDVDGFTFDELVQKIVLESPTVLAFSSYIWNYQLNLELGKTIKSILPEIIIVYGGPEAPFENDNFEKLKWIDLVVSRDGFGELFISELLDQLAENKLKQEDIPFCLYPSPDGKKLIRSLNWPQRINFQWPQSIFRGNESEVTVLKHIAESRGERLGMLWETTRGCPFSCSYCDWGGGTNAKILQKSWSTLIEELTFMKKLNVRHLEFCDANFGILQNRDIEILNFLIEQSKEGWKFTVSFYGKTKKNVEVANKIDQMMMNNGLLHSHDYFFAINASTLKVAGAVNRSSFQTQKQLEHLINLKEQGRRVKLELVLGLPESTLETFYSEFNLYESVGAWHSARHIWLMLKGSPASQPTYIEKYKIKTAVVRYPNTPEIKVATTGYSVLNDRLFQGYFEIVIQTNSYSRADWVQMFFMDHFASGLEACQITTELRELCGKSNFLPSDFYRSCWSAVNGLEKSAGEYRDKIFASINEALDKKGAVTIMSIDGQIVNLPVACVTLAVKFSPNFCHTLHKMVPTSAEITKCVDRMNLKLLKLAENKDLLTVLSELYSSRFFAGENVKNNEELLKI